jgi:hypothetical protein
MHLSSLGPSWTANGSIGVKDLFHFDPGAREWQIATGVGDS